MADPQGGRILRNPHPGLYPPPMPERPPCPPGCYCAEPDDDDTPVPGFAPVWPSTTPTASEDDACALPVTQPPPGLFDPVRPRGLAFSRDGDLIVTDEGNDIHPGRLLVYSWPSIALRHEIKLAGRPWDVAVDASGRILVADMAGGRVLRFDRLWRRDDWRGGAGQLWRPRHLVIGSDGTLLVIDTDPETGRGRLSQFDHLGIARPVEAPDTRAIWQAGTWPPPIQDRDGALFAPGDPCVELGRPLLGVTLDRRGRLPQGPTLIYRPRQGQRFRDGTLYLGPLDGESFNFAWHRILFDCMLGMADALDIQTLTNPVRLEPERVEAMPEQAWSRRILLKDGSPTEALDPVAAGPLPVAPPAADRRRHEQPAAQRRGSARPAPVEPGVLARAVPRGRHRPRLPRPVPELLRHDFRRDHHRFHPLRRRALATRRARGGVPVLAPVLVRHRGHRLLGRRHPPRLPDQRDAPAPGARHGSGTDRSDPAAPRPRRADAGADRGHYRLRFFAERRALSGAVDMHDGSLRIAGIPLTEPLVEGDTAHCFTVVVPEAAVPDEDARETLVRLVDAYRPAHTDWRLIVARPGLRVGCQSMIGVDTLLGGTPSAPLGEARLGQTAITAPPSHTAARVGDARLVSQTL